MRDLGLTYALIIVFFRPMDVQTITFLTFCAVVLTCVAFLAYRAMKSASKPLMALGQDSDSLRTRVFPLLGFFCLLAILLKLSLF